MKDTVVVSGLDFNNLGITPKFLEILEKVGYTSPTPIQHKAIPLAIQGKDILGIAQTGTGKTLAFAVPLIQRLEAEKGRAIVIVPTRELALQVNETFEKIGRRLGLKTAVLIGGAPMHFQNRSLQNNPHVIVGTPGRIFDHIERKSLKLDTVKILVLDEADLMLDMGFAPQINRILAHVPRERQTMLFSATVPEQIEKIAASYMNAPLRVEVARSGTLPEKIIQELYYCDSGTKISLLETLLKKYEGSVLVFVRTKFGAKKLCYELMRSQYRVAEIHSNRSLAQRRAALDGFKSGKNRILVATDIAARGIDVSGIALVINYDLPDNPDDYVHRIGRTGRAGLSGHAISFVSHGQQQLVRRIEKTIRGTLTIIGEKPQEKTAIYPKRHKSFGSHQRTGGTYQRSKTKVWDRHTTSSQRSDSRQNSPFRKDGPDHRVKKKVRVFSYSWKKR